MVAGHLFPIDLFRFLIYYLDCLDRTADNSEIPHNNDVVGVQDRLYCYFYDIVFT